MRRGVTISTEAQTRAGQRLPSRAGRLADAIHRTTFVTATVVFAFGMVAVQLVRLAATGAPVVQSNMSSPIATSLARPDIVDRNGRLLASDVEAPSLYADPLLISDRDEVVEKLRAVLPDLDSAALRDALADKTRRFVWVRRGLSPQMAQRVHDLGLPGLAFRNELRRAYPGGRLAGHVLGGVNIDNRAIAGIERHLDESNLVEPIVHAAPSTRRPVVLSLDLGVQHALEDELAAAMETYRASATAGLVLDVRTGEVLASAAMPGVDPAIATDALVDERIDRISGGTYELGSIFKLMTVAEALDAGRVGPGSMVDVTEPLKSGRFVIEDPHPAGRPLTVSEVFLKSSNVGAARLALGGGPTRQRAFLDSLGLLAPMRTEAAAIARPMLPARWEDIETITIAYGHGLAVAPLQFAAAAAALVNGGEYIQPTFLKRTGEAPRRRVIRAETSAELRELMARNVAEGGGTGKRADAEGFAVGGKTGTAEIATRGKYDRNAVISSFLGAFPISEPRYLTLVMVFEPARTAASGGEVTASQTAAPVTARLVRRIAPQLGVWPAPIQP